jgi:hypothetical protein
MTQEKITMQQLEQNLIDELNSNKKEILENQYPDDLVTELADSYVPIYNMGTFIFLLGILAAIGVVYPLLVVMGIIKDR